VDTIVNPARSDYAAGFQQANDDLHNGFARPCDRFEPVKSPYQEGWNARMQIEGSQTFVGSLIVVLVIIMLLSAAIWLVQLWTAGS
jgi:hypothetical protein